MRGGGRQAVRWARRHFIFCRVLLFPLKLLSRGRSLLGLESCTRGKWGAVWEAGRYFPGKAAALASPCPRSCPSVTSGGAASHGSSEPCDLFVSVPPVGGRMHVGLVGKVRAGLSRGAVGEHAVECASLGQLHLREAFLSLPATL